MGKVTLTVNIRIVGLRDTLKAFRELPKDAVRELRQASLSIAGALAVDVRQDARADSSQSALMAPTVRAVFDRVPAITAGGTRRVGRNKVPAYKVLFGSIFGSKSLPQFRPFDGDGYWFFGTVQREQDKIAREWTEAADEVIRKWAS